MNERVQNGQIFIQHIRTNSMIADSLTKGLPVKVFHERTAWYRWIFVRGCNFGGETPGEQKLQGRALDVCVASPHLEEAIVGGDGSWGCRRLPSLQHSRGHSKGAPPKVQPVLSQGPRRRGKDWSRLKARPAKLETPYLRWSPRDLQSRSILMVIDQPRL